MDDHGQLEYATASGNDYAAHEQMYRIVRDADEVLRRGDRRHCYPDGDFPHLKPPVPSGS